MSLDMYTNLTNVLSLKSELAKDEKDSSCSVSIYDPDGLKYLDPKRRFRVQTKLAGKTLNFEAACKRYDLSTRVAELSGNSPAWRANVEEKRKVYQKVKVGSILKEKGVSTVGVPPAILNRTVSVIQKDETDYKFLLKLLKGLGVQLRGKLDGSNKLEAFVPSLAKSELTVSINSTSIATTTTLSIPGQLLTANVSWEEEQKKTGPKEAPKPGNPKGEHPKSLKMDPVTGRTQKVEGRVAPKSSLGSAQAQIRKLKCSLSFVSPNPPYLEAGSVLSLSLASQSGSRTIKLVVEKASYEYFPEFIKVSLETVSG